MPRPGHTILISEPAFRIMPPLVAPFSCSRLQVPEGDRARLKRIINCPYHPQKIADEFDELFNRELDDALVSVTQYRHP